MIIDELEYYNSVCKAIVQDDAESVRLLLLACPAAIRLRDSEGKTPLHVAASRLGDCADMVALLLSFGADPGATDNIGFTPFEWADFYLNRDVCLLFNSNY